MTVRRADNSGTPTAIQGTADITDGTSNTLQSAAKAEKPFSKDIFESSKPTANGLCTNEQLPLSVHSDDPKLKLQGAKGQVVENLNVKYTLFLPDGITSPKDPHSGLLDGEKGLEKPAPKKSFMDYTDD
jgi:hypothetical protein